MAVLTSFEASSDKAELHSETCWWLLLPLISIVAKVMSGMESVVSLGSMASSSSLLPFHEIGDVVISYRMSSLSVELFDFLYRSGLMSGDWFSGDLEEIEKEVFYALSMLIF